jgi:peptide deformylase
LVRPILTFPHSTLKRVCDPVSRAGAEAVVRDLVDTMRSLERCVGLAAPQIGEPVRVAVVDVSSHPAAQAHNGLLVLINPVVTAARGRELGREGCQSLPGITADVTRSRRLTLLSELQEIWSAGIEARAVQHEIDHLDGVLILDRVASVAAIHVRDPLKQPLPNR